MSPPPKKNDQKNIVWRKKKITNVLFGIFSINHSDDSNDSRVLIQHKDQFLDLGSGLAIGFTSTNEFDIGLSNLILLFAYRQ